MLKQYEEIKAEYADTILLSFRLGDFYEMFLRTPKLPRRHWRLS